MKIEHHEQTPKFERKKPTTKEMLAWYRDYLKRREEGESNEYCDILDTMECLVDDHDINELKRDQTRSDE